MMDRRYFWQVESVSSLTTQVRNALVSRYGYTAPAEHTHGAVVQIIERSGSGVLVAQQFATSIRAADWTGRTGDLEAHIGDDCRARLLALRNAEPLTAILGRRHAL
jgi:hypothetical protein